MLIDAKSRRLATMIQTWAGEEDGTVHLTRYALLEYLSERHFGDYEPCLAPPQPFLGRLWDWLMNTPDVATRKQLFALLDNLVYFNQGQFHSLYRTAYSSRVRPWLFSQTGLSFDAPEFESVYDRILARTWFCPITDSMRINAFYHANKLPSAKYRPDWHSLSQFGDAAKLSVYLSPTGRYDRLVLLEDFVGSGTQMNGAVRFAGALASTPPVLVVPLLSCVDAAAVGQALAVDFPHVAYSPVIEFDHTSQVKPNPEIDDLPWQASARELATRLHSQVAGVEVQLEAFGYRNTGAFMSMYSNTPNNSLPLLHHDSATWKPLLPRSIRS